MDNTGRVITNVSSNLGFYRCVAPADKNRLLMGLLLKAALLLDSLFNCALFLWCSL